MKLTTRRALARVCFGVLLVDGACFLLVGALDLSWFGGGVISPLLSLAVGVICVVALIEITKERAKARGLSNPRRREKLALGGTRVVARQPWELASVAVAQAAAIPLLIAPLRTEGNSIASDPEDLAICVIGLLLAAIAICITVVVLWVGKAVSPSRIWMALLALLPLVGFFQFWYTNFYRPVHQRPNVNIVASLDDIGAEGATHRMKATVTLTNTGPTDLSFLEAAYTVTALGIPGANHDLSEPELADASKRVAAENPSVGHPELRQVGRLIRPRGHLAPGQELLTSFIFDVDGDVQRKLRLTVHLQVVVGDGDNWRSVSDCSVPDGDTRSVCQYSRLVVPGVLRHVLSDGLVVRTAMSAPVNGLPQISTQFGYRGEQGHWRSANGQSAGQSEELQDFYPYSTSRRFTSSVEYGFPP